MTLTVDPLVVPEDRPTEITVATQDGVTFTEDQPITLTFDGSATQRSDYTVSAELTLRARQSTGSTTLRVTDDTIAEDAETIRITAHHRDEAVGTLQIITIPANDQPAEAINIYAGKDEAFGEAEGAYFNLTRGGNRLTPLDVTVAVTVNGRRDMLASPLPSSVSFPERVETVTLHVPPRDDTIVEGEMETSEVIATLVADTHAPPLYIPGADYTATVTVEDDDKAEFAVIVSPTVTEGSPAPVTVTVTITNDVTFASDQPLTLVFSGEAEQGMDYTVESDTLTLTAGESAVMTALTIIDDGAKELAETIQIAVQNAGQEVVRARLTIAASEDTKPPTLEEAEVPRAGRSLRLTFSEPLDEAEWHRPAATAFTVTVAGEPRAVTSVTVSGEHVVLGLTSPVRPGQEVTVGYTMPAGRPAPPVLQDPAGHAVESFPDGPVENDSQFGRRPPGRPPGGGPPGGGGPVCAEDVHGNTAAQATGIALATETAGAICPAADVDYFTLTASGRGLVFVDTTGSVNLRGTLWQDGEELATGPTGRGQGTRLGALVQAGAVVVAVAGQGGATGDYEIVVTFSPGYLENPGDDSFQSGIGVISGWVCEADACGD